MKKITTKMFDNKKIALLSFFSYAVFFVRSTLLVGMILLRHCQQKQSFVL